MISRYAKASVVLIIFFFLSLQIPDDPDLGVNLGVGHFILQTKTFPYHDLFSFSLPNHPYVYHSWLGQVVITLVYEGAGELGKLGISGLRGLTLVWTWGITLGVYLLYRSCRQSLWLLLAFLVVTAVVFSSIGVRPQMFTFLGMVVEVGLLFRWRGGIRENRGNQGDRAGKILWFLVPLFGLWANLHLGFVMGLLVLVLFMGVEMVESGRGLGSFGSLGDLGVLLLSFLATLVNPYGFGVYQTAWKIAQNPINNQANLEWAPLVARGNFHWAFAGVVLVLFGLMLRQKKLDFTLFIISSVLFWLTLKNTRTTLIFLVVFLPWISSLLSQFPSPMRFIKPFAFSKLPVYVALCLVPLAVLDRGVVNYAITHAAVSNLQFLAHRGGYPYGAVEFLKKNPRAYHLLNYYNWGGYLVWQIPTMKVFETGIMDVFTVDNHLFLDDYFALVQGKPEWKSLIGRYGINAVLLPPNQALVQLLHQDPNWEVAYQDNQSVLMQKSNL